MRGSAFYRVGAAVALSLVAGAFASGARAEQFTYQIDPTRSTLTAGGTMTGNTALPQKAGSNVTIYSGTILADVTETTIDFLDGGLIDAALSASGTVQPGNGGAAGSAAGNYGLQSASTSGTVFAAYRGLAINPLSGDPLVRSVTGGIPANQFRVRYEEGDVDFRAASGIFNQLIVADKFGFNNSPGEATLVVVGDREEFTIPIDFSVPFGFLSSNDTSFRLTGTLVATRTIIPEPASIALVLIGASLLTRRRRA